VSSGLLKIFFAACSCGGNEEEGWHGNRLGIALLRQPSPADRNLRSLDTDALGGWYPLEAQLQFFTELGTHWMVIKDGDPAARELADKHYSRQTPGHPLFCGPGTKLILTTPDYRALFIWRRERFRRDGQQGINCAMFRNESGLLSSILIREAEEVAWMRWPGERLFTFVKAGAIRSINPGCCFKKAGWRHCGCTKKNGLLIFEKMPH
jgi:hypothetical protein